MIILSQLFNKLRFLKYIFICILVILISRISFSAKVDTVKVFSSSMQKEIPVLVILPEVYFRNDSIPPILILLHGYGGDFTSWYKNNPNLVKQSDETGFIFLCPEGSDSWYIDNAKENSFYESFITKELLDFTDSLFKIRIRHHPLHICGVSMGGHGALYLALKYPEKFASASSLSGVINLKDSKVSNLLAKRFGNSEEDFEALKSFSVQNITINPSKKLPNLLISVGNSDHLFLSNQIFHNRLLNLNIKHNFIIIPGQHDWACFNRLFEHQLVFLKLIK